MDGRLSETSQYLLCVGGPSAGTEAFFDLRWKDTKVPDPRPQDWQSRGLAPQPVKRGVSFTCYTLRMWRNVVDKDTMEEVNLLAPVEMTDGDVMKELLRFYREKH